MTGDAGVATTPAATSAPADVPSPGGLLSLEAARDAVLAAIAAPLPAVTVALDDPAALLGRALAAPVVAATDLPPWDNSAMDGYAIRAADVAAARDEAPIRLRVRGEVAAGDDAFAARRVEAGEAIRIATGAPMPPGADAVVPVELTTPLDAHGTPAGERGREAVGPPPPGVAVHAAVPAGNAIRERGSDLRADATILEAGTEVTPAIVALAAGSGAGSVALHRRPRVGVLVTGDEIRRPGEPLGPAGIPDANGPALRALVAAAGGEPVDLGIARDRVDDVLDRLRAAVAGPTAVDAVIVSGGVSVGPYDVVRSAFGEVGSVDLWRVAVQPGKPFAFGLARGGALLFGLPGNPVSTFVTFELFVRPALRRLAGQRTLLRAVERAIIEDEATTSAGRRAFLRVAFVTDEAGTLRRDEGGRPIVRLAGGQGSHVLSALAAADALAVVPEAVRTVVPGTEVELWRLDR